MNKHAYRNFDENPMAMLMALQGMSALGNSIGQGRGSIIPETYDTGTFGGGMRDMGLAQLSMVNPEAARLAQARLEAEANVNSMGPFTGWWPGAIGGGLAGGLAGGALGGLMGSGMSQASYANPAYPSWTPLVMGALGAGLGGLTGAAAGGRFTRGLEAERRRSQAYQEALKRLGAARGQASA